MYYCNFMHEFICISTLKYVPVFFDWIFIRIPDISGLFPDIQSFFNFFKYNISTYILFFCLRFFSGFYPDFTRIFPGFLNFFMFPFFNLESIFLNNMICFFSIFSAVFCFFCLFRFFNLFFFSILSILSRSWTFKDFSLCFMYAHLIFIFLVSLKCFV